MKFAEYPCIVCAFKPTIWVGRFVGFSPITIKCAEPGQPCEFTPSRLYIFVGVLLAGLISGTMIATFNGNSQTLNLGIPQENLSTTKVITTVECLNHLTSMVLLVLNTLQSRTTARALNSIAKFLHSPGVHSKRSITVADERALFTVAMWQVLSLLAFLAVQTSVVVYFLSKHWSQIPNPEFIILKGVVAGLCNVICLINGFQFAIVTKLLRLMIINVRAQLQSLILKAQTRVSTNAIANATNSNVKKLSESRICDEIAEVRRVYGRVVKCLHKFNHSVNPQLAIITALIMVSVVLSSYLIFQYALTHNEEILYLQVSGRLFSNIVTALYMIQLSQALLEMVINQLPVGGV